MFIDRCKLPAKKSGSGKKKMFVYLADTINGHKIGVTSDLRKRVSTLSRENECDVSIIHYFEVSCSIGFKAERNCHYFFSERKSDYRREYFNLIDSDIEVFKSESFKNDITGKSYDAVASDHYNALTVLRRERDDLIANINRNSRDAAKLNEKVDSLNNMVKWGRERLKELEDRILSRNNQFECDMDGITAE